MVQAAGYVRLYRVRAACNSLLICNHAHESIAHRSFVRAEVWCTLERIVLIEKRDDDDDDDDDDVHGNYTYYVVGRSS